MNKTPQYDSKVKEILDNLKPGQRTCELTGKIWDMTEEEIGWYKKFNVPPSKLHPHTRMRLLHGFSSGIELWWKKHAKTGKPILSFVHPDNPYQVITDKEWMSAEFLHDKPELQTNQPFFDQMWQLALSVPVSALRDDGSSKNTIGVDYIKSEDSYMVFSLPEARRCFYTVLSLYSQDSLDCANAHNCQNCFRCNRTNKCYNCKFAFESRDCINCSFLFDCRNCEDCFGATNQRNKKYLWFNEQLSKEEYERRLAEVDLSCYSTLQKHEQDFQDLMKQAVWPENFDIGCTDCTGEYVEESTRCQKGFWVRGSKDVFNSWMMEDFEDAAYSSWAGWGSLIYNSCDVCFGSWLRFCFRTWQCQNVEYCMDCHDCEYCFGCVGLRKKRYCIYNVQYSENEYWSKLDELKCAMLDSGEYGDFFTAKFSQNGLEYSMADAFWGFTDTELEALDAPRFDPLRGGVVLVDEQEAQTETSTDKIPDSISDPSVADYIGKPLLDAELKRNFSITEPELAFYKKNNLPLPRQHFLQRLKNLMRQANSPLPEQVECASCQKGITTYKNSQYLERNVYCHDCYLKFLETR